MNLFAHPVAQRSIDELVALHPASPGESRTHHNRLEMLAVATHLKVFALQACNDALPYGFWSDHSLSAEVYTLP